MLKKGAELEERDLFKDPRTADELDALTGRGSYLDYLDPKNELYRKLRMKQKPSSRAEALKLMAKEPNHIRRPIVIRGREMVFG